MGQALSAPHPRQENLSVLHYDQVVLRFSIAAAWTSYGQSDGVDADFLINVFWRAAKCTVLTIPEVPQTGIEISIGGIGERHRQRERTGGRAGREIGQDVIGCSFK